MEGFKDTLGNIIVVADLRATGVEVAFGIDPGVVILLVLAACETSSVAIALDVHDEIGHVVGDYIRDNRDACSVACCDHASESSLVTPLARKLVGSRTVGCPPLIAGLDISKISRFPDPDCRNSLYVHWASRSARACTPCRLKTSGKRCERNHSRLPFGQVGAFRLNGLPRCREATVSLELYFDVIGIEDSRHSKSWIMVAPALSRPETAVDATSRVSGLRVRVI